MGEKVRNSLSWVRRRGGSLGRFQTEEIEMAAEDIERSKQECISRFGPWTAHCIHLGDGVYTFNPPQVAQADSRLRRFLQVAADISEKPIDELRILDLGCLEGMFAIEFALHGSQVVAIEGREVNLAKARFARDALRLDNVDFIRDDVRKLSTETHGVFDVILCLGILYHLDAPDVLLLAQRMFEVCARAVIIDTHISFDDSASYSAGGRTYQGQYVGEHDERLDSEQRLAALWRSLDNPRSFVPTYASLCNLLRHVGFTSVYEVRNPFEYHNQKWPGAPEDGAFVVHKDRVTLVAVKGRPQTLISSPLTERSPEIDRTENPVLITGGPRSPGAADLSRTLRSRAGRLLPGPLKQALKWLLPR
jgi:SAM-dependent methyltransferase